MKLLTLSVLLMLACAAFGKAVNEVPAQEEEGKAVEAVEDFELTGEEQAEDDSNAVMESDTEESDTEVEQKEGCWRICRRVPKKVCRKYYGRYRCYTIYVRRCHKVCYRG